MNLFDLSGIDDFFKKYGYEKIDMSAGGKDNIFKDLNLDIPEGFQDINPILFVTIADVLGDIMSGNMPFNVANSVSNFFQLVGQILETCSVQILYFEAGPGRFYSPLNKNVDNPYCRDEEGQEVIDEEIKKLNVRIDELEKKIESLK